MKNVLDWIKARGKEASTLDGVTIAVISGLVLLSSPFVKYVAVAGVAFGIWRMIKKDEKDS